MIGVVFFLFHNGLGIDTGIHPSIVSAFLFSFFINFFQTFYLLVPRSGEKKFNREIVITNLASLPWSFLFFLSSSWNPSIIFSWQVSFLYYYACEEKERRDQADTKDLTSSSKFSACCVLTLQTTLLFLSHVCNSHNTRMTGVTCWCRHEPVGGVLTERKTTRQASWLAQTMNASHGNLSNNQHTTAGSPGTTVSRLSFLRVHVCDWKNRWLIHDTQTQSHPSQSFSHKDLAAKRNGRGNRL